MIKLLYSVIKAIDNLSRLSTESKERLGAEIAQELKDIFLPESLGRLVTHIQGRNKSEIEIHFGDEKLRFDFANNSKTNVNIENNIKFEKTQSIYLPPHEMLSMYEGFIGIYDKYEQKHLWFDKTYYNLARELVAPPLKGRKAESIAGLYQPLKDCIPDLKVTKKDNRFYITTANGTFESSLIAEGYRKIAMLQYLLMNESLMENSILFWDEPEANMNPNMIDSLVRFIIKLADNGIQIFITTHDYLLSQKLSLIAENASISEKPDMKFFCLYRDNDNKVQCESGNNLLEIDNNPILEEFAKHYDDEINTLHQTIR